MSNCAEIKRSGGGLVLSHEEMAYQSPLPLTNHEQPGDVSWLTAVRTGNDQGNDGACALFAIASWATVMLGKHISDYERLLVYKKTWLKLKRHSGAGLTPYEAFNAASEAGWLPGMSRIQPVWDLADLQYQPILAGYMVTPAWDSRNVSFEGCLDHTKLKPERGLHMVQIVAHGEVDNLDGKWVYIENSWGRMWGWRGLGVMNYNMHNALCQGMWVIK